MKLSCNVKAVLRPDKKKADGTIPIHFSIRVGPTTSRIPTGKFTKLSDWNIQDNSPKQSTKQGQLLAAFLQKKISDWKTYMFAEEYMGKSITLTKGLEFFRENTKVTLFSFWEEQMNLWQNSKQNNTLKSYKSSLKILKAFNNKLNFGDLTYDVIQKFDLYLTNERSNALGGRFVKHKCLKSIINQAIMKGFMNVNPYRYFKIKASTGKRNFLSILEVKILMNLEIPEQDTFQQMTRDLFLFSCFTGLRYSDVMNLRWSNIKTNPMAVTVTMTKTKKQVMVPLIDPAAEIIERFNKHTIRAANNTVFPYICNQVLNRNLKDLMKSAGINRLITYHSSRHTFASNHVEMGTNIIHLKDLLGHSKLTETQVYAKSLESDLFVSMNKMQSTYDLNHAV
jgi:integrase/recombinase XerD